jgi:23S rRNA pseudouridine1911/1915/1917 synthase
MEKKEGEVSSYLVEGGAHRIFSVDDPGTGRFAKTGYKVVKESANFSLVEIKLFTGRKNQIRVHFADLGHPIAGDKVYGKKDKDINRLTLHAASLTIIHPFSKEKMTFETEFPRYFKALVK